MFQISKSHVPDYFEKQFDKLPKNIRRIATRKLILFESNPYHPGLETHKLKGALSAFWAFSVNKKYRVLFRFLKDNEVIYYDVDTHDIYK